MAYKSKSYRKFIATGTTAALVASAIAPAASAADHPFTDVNTNYDEAVSYLYSNDITKGYTETTFGTYMSLTRGNAAVIIANALGLDTENAEDAGFEDVNSRVAGAVNALVEAGIMDGYSDTEFKPEVELSRGAMAKILVNAYDLSEYSTDTPFTDLTSTFGEYIEALYGAEITSGKTETTFGTNAEILRGEFAVLLYKTINFEAPVQAPVVESVEAVDGKTIEVTFNNPIDEDTLKDSSENDVISLVAGKDAKKDYGTVTQELSEDGMTLTLKASAFFKGDYTVKVPFEIVKDENGEYVAPVNAKVTVNDTAAPTLTSADATVKDTKEAVKSATLTFDEDVKSIDNVKVNGVNYTPVVSGNKATISGLNLDAAKSFDVTVVNAEDAAGNVKGVQSTSLNVSVDSQAPSIVGVEASGENTVKVTVDKALAGGLVISGKVGSFNADIVQSAVVNPKNNKEYTVTLNNSYLFKSGNTDTVTLTVAKEALVDSLGNKNSAEITEKVTVVKDVVVPSVVDVETTTANGEVTGFVVTFSEEVKTPDLSKVSVVNSKGEILSASSLVGTSVVSAKDAKKVVFTLNADVKEDKYGFDLAEGFVLDTALSANKSAKHAFTVDVTDAETPVATSFTIKSATALNNVVTVDFGEKVKATGSGSALNPASYQVNGVALPSDAKIAFDTSTGSLDQSKVVITLPDGFIKSNDDKAIFRVTGVETLDNKVNNSFVAQVVVTDNTAPELKSFVATNLNELTVTYSEGVTAKEDISDELNLFNSKGAAVAIDSFTVSTDGKLVLTVADAASVTKVTTVKTDDVDIADANGIAQKAGLTVTK
jgi:trimeric autotransporter adhesin